VLWGFRRDHVGFARAHDVATDIAERVDVAVIFT
jgi:hypothetical protein